MWDHLAREIATQFLADKLINRSSGSPPEVDPETGGLLFRYRAWPRFFITATSGILIAGIIYLVATIPVESDTDFWGMLALFSVFGLLFLGAIWVVWRTRIIVTTEGLQGTAPFRGRQSIPWNTLRDIRFGGGKFEFRSNFGDRLSIQMSAVNLNPLFDILETVYPGSFFANLKEGYKKLKRPLPARDAPPRQTSPQQDSASASSR